MTYTEKLKDPRWQRKRLEILKRNDFACESCHRDDRTLHVHHGYYAKGREPWDYPDNTLHALCEECHEAAQYALDKLYEKLAALDVLELHQVLGYAAAIEARTSGNITLPPDPEDDYSTWWIFGILDVFPTILDLKRQPSVVGGQTS